MDETEEADADLKHVTDKYAWYHKVLRGKVESPAPDADASPEEAEAWKKEHAKEMDGHRATLMKAIEEVVRPKMDEMSEKSWKWLHNNNYEQILDVDVAKLLFADGEAVALQQLEEARRTKEGEVKVAELQVENVQTNIEELNNE